MAARKVIKKQLTIRQRRAMKKLGATYRPGFDPRFMKPKTVLARRNYRSQLWMINSMGDFREVETWPM